MFRDTRIFFKSLFQSVMPLKTLSSRLTFIENKVFFGEGIRVADQLVLMKMMRNKLSKKTVAAT